MEKLIISVSIIILLVIIYCLQTRKPANENFNSDKISEEETDKENISVSSASDAINESISTSDLMELTSSSKVPIPSLSSANDIPDADVGEGKDLSSELEISTSSVKLPALDDISRTALVDDEYRFEQNPNEVPSAPQKFSTIGTACFCPNFDYGIRMRSISQTIESAHGSQVTEGGITAETSDQYGRNEGQNLKLTMDYFQPSNDEPILEGLRDVKKKSNSSVISAQWLGDREKEKFVETDWLYN